MKGRKNGETNKSSGSEVGHKKIDELKPKKYVLSLVILKFDES